MNARHFLAAVALATTLAACCGAEEEHAVTISPGIDSLTLTRDGVARKFGTISRATVPPASHPTFEFVFNTLEGNTIGDGIALSVGGDDPVTNELVLVSLALPMSLRIGDQYQVGATYTVQPGLDNAPGVFGAYELQQPNQAETAFTASTYTFPPGVYNATYQAATTTGTVRVIERERGRIVLSLNLNFTDAAGKPATVTGLMHATTERFTPPCTT